MKTKNKSLTAGIMLCLLQLSTVPVQAQVFNNDVPYFIPYDASKIVQPAPDADTGGTVLGRSGDIHWSYTAEHKLLQIWGTGYATYYADYMMLGSDGGYDSGFSVLPWQAVRNHVKVAVVHEGITSLGTWEFKNFENLEKLVLPNSLKYTYAETVTGCPKLKEIHYGTDTDFPAASLFGNNGVEKLFLKKIPRTSGRLELTGAWTAAYANTHYPFLSMPDTKQITTIVPVDKLEEARASVVLQHPNNTIISEYDYYAAGGGVYDSELTVYDTTRVPVTVNDTTYIPVTDTVYSYMRIYLTDTVYTTEYETRYNIIFVPLEIKTGIYPYPEKTDTPFLYRLTPTTFRSSSPYDRETLYFYNISGELTDKVTYTGGGTVQTSRPLYHTIIAVSDRGWYQIIR